jgi:hypothetical protein
MRNGMRIELINAELQGLWGILSQYPSRSHEKHITDSQAQEPNRVPNVGVKFEERRQCLRSNHSGFAGTFIFDLQRLHNGEWNKRTILLRREGIHMWGKSS